MTSEKGRFQKGHKTWNKGKKGYTNSGSFKKGHEFIKGSEKSWFKKGHIPKHSKIKKEELIRMYKEGKSINEIAEHFRCRIATVYQFFDRYKLKLRTRLDGEPYTKEFNLKFKNLIRKRDNQICMLCNIHREKLKEALLVHHINYNKQLSIPENSISLCRSCHGKTNGNRKLWIQFFQSLLSMRYGYQYSETNEIILEVENSNIEGS